MKIIFKHLSPFGTRKLCVLSVIFIVFYICFNVLFSFDLVFCWVLVVWVCVEVPTFDMQCTDTTYGVCMHSKYKTEPIYSNFKYMHLQCSFNFIKFSQKLQPRVKTKTTKKNYYFSLYRRVNLSVFENRNIISHWKSSCSKTDIDIVLHTPEMRAKRQTTRTSSVPNANSNTIAK